MKQKQEYQHYYKLESYTDFIDYCLRRLGAPVVDINVTPEQIADRISDAVQYYIENDLDAQVEKYVLHRVTKEDCERGYFLIPGNILDIYEVMDTRRSLFKFEIKFESPEYAWFQSFWQSEKGVSATDNSLAYFESAMQYLRSIKQEFEIKPSFYYRRREHKLELVEQQKPGQIICLHCMEVLDPETNDSLWNSDWLKSYATCLIGLQWGTNLQKFDGIKVAGDMTVNSSNILQRYMEEKTRLEEVHTQKYEKPACGFFG